MDSTFDVVGIGNAIVDVLSHADDQFLTERGLQKGAMTLIDAAAAEQLYTEMGSSIECSGGSAANTIACLASLGGRGAFIGKARDDQLGRVFSHDIRTLGISFKTAPAQAGPPTARCLILVTPDAQRTMQTFLGASIELGPDDIDEDEIAAAEVTYLEGYLWDPPAAKQAFLKAARIAHKHGRKMALSLSDPFCVSRHRDDFATLVEDHIDLLFANEDEIMALYQTPDFDQALQRVRGKCEIAVLTRSEKGSVVIAGDEIHVIDAEPATPVDTTGAGDAYAGGFLFGFTRGMALDKCAHIGSIVAAQIISHVGARPDIPLRQIVEQRLS